MVNMVKINRFLPCLPENCSGATDNNKIQDCHFQDDKAYDKSPVGAKPSFQGSRKNDDIDSV